MVRLFVDLKAGSHESISDPIFTQTQRSYWRKSAFLWANVLVKALDLGRYIFL